jgi:hypothetical protein
MGLYFHADNMFQGVVCALCVCHTGYILSIYNPVWTYSATMSIISFEGVRWLHYLHPRAVLDHVILRLHHLVHLLILRLNLDPGHLHKVYLHSLSSRVLYHHVLLLGILSDHNVHLLVITVNVSFAEVIPGYAHHLHVLRVNNYLSFPMGL